MTHSALLSRKELTVLLNRKDVSDRLVISPLLNPNLQIGIASIDLRLGFEFIVYRSANIAAIDPMAENSRQTTNRIHRRLTLRVGQELYLHEKELVLGCSLEYLRLPPKVAGLVTSRSSWGRLGQISATAQHVAPGFTGVITLELKNLGVAPLVLRPGVAIAQILLYWSANEELYRGRYSLPVRPDFGRISEDRDLDVWRRDPFTKQS